MKNATDVVSTKHAESVLSKDNSALFLSDRASQLSENNPSMIMNNRSQLSLERQASTRQRRRYCLNSEQQCCRLTKSIVQNGKFIYINVLGQNDEDIIRPMTTLKKVSSKAANQLSPVKFVGTQSDELSKQEKVIIDYINSELQSSQTSLKAKEIVRNKYFNIPKLDISSIINERKKQLKSNSHRRELIKKRRLSMITNQKCQLNPEQTTDRKLSSRESMQRGFSNLLEISKNQQNIMAYSKTNKRYKQHQSLSRENRREINEFLLKKRMYVQQSPKQSPKKQLSPREKYDISFNDYMVKKTNKRIEKTLLARIEKKHNIVDEYQDYALQNVLLSQRNKEQAQKRFEQINRQRRRLKL